jgi:hypothetical protein
MLGLKWKGIAAAKIALDSEGCQNPTVLNCSHLENSSAIRKAI